MEMQVTKIVGIKETGAKRQSGLHIPEQRPGREAAAAGNARASKAVREKLCQGAEGATVVISAEGLGLVKRDETENNDARRKEIEKQMYQEMLENTKEAAKAQGEGQEDLAKALEIARRILNGDIVPAQDEKFLMEYNSEIYMRVKSMAEAKEDPEEYDSLLEDEEEDDNRRSGGESSGGVRNNTSAEAPQTEGEAAATDEIA